MSKSTFWVLFSSVVIISMVLLFFRLGYEPFIDYDEASYASIIDSTVKSPDITVPMIGQSPSFEKPPLYFWLGMASGNLSDNKELAYRAPAAICGILGIILVILIVLEISGSYGAALFGGIVLLTSGIFFEAARQLRLDVPVTVCMLVALFCFLKGKKDPRWYIGMGIGIGLGIMFKSVIGLAGIPIILVWAACSADWHWLKSRYTWIGALATAAIVVPWHWHESILFGSAFWDRYIGFTVFSRISSNIMNNTESTFEYAKIFFWSLLPWSAVLILAFVYSIRRVFSKLEKLRDDPILPPALVSFCIIVFFLSSQTKLEYYFVPAAPFIAITVALFVWKLMQSGKIKASASIPVCAALVVVGLVIMRQVGFDKDPILSGWVRLAEEESAIGRMISVEPDQTFYVYKYPFLDTLRYYSGGKDIVMLEPGTKLSKSILFVIAAPDYAAKPFPPELQNRMTVKYQGRLPVLVRIN